MRKKSCPELVAAITAPVVAVAGPGGAPGKRARAPRVTKSDRPDPAQLDVPRLFPEPGSWCASGFGASLQGGIGISKAAGQRLSVKTQIEIRTSPELTLT
jgi:hypothetical protein